MTTNCVPWHIEWVNRNLIRRWYASSWMVKSRLSFMSLDKSPSKIFSTINVPWGCKLLSLQLLNFKRQPIIRNSSKLFLLKQKSYISPTHFKTHCQSKKRGVFSLIFSLEMFTLGDCPLSKVKMWYLITLFLIFFCISLLYKRAAQPNVARGDHNAIWPIDKEHFWLLHNNSWKLYFLFLLSLLLDEYFPTILRGLV